MAKNGWIFSSELMHQVDLDDQCGNDTYNEYQNIEEVGTIYSTFDGNGVATMIFLNCYNGSENGGYVSVSIKAKEIVRAYKNEEMKISFNYSKDDSLIIKIFGTSTFKIMYFMIDRCGKNCILYF